MKFHMLTTGKYIIEFMKHVMPGGNVMQDNMEFNLDGLSTAFIW